MTDKKTTGGNSSSFAVRHSSFFICLALTVVTLAIYSPMLRHPFINYDDPDYILNNPHVKAGLTWPGIVWAFTSGDEANWHPLTWISHMTDCQLFGLNPAGHHLVNLLFHTATALLLFILFKNLTGAAGRSAFVAAAFAWHPLHVESVAWAAERKDVLSAFFWMLTLLAYVRFANLSQARSPKSKVFYAGALFFFACGLMSKPMIVTLPCVLLLLDFWPLGRMEGFKPKAESSQRATGKLRLITEKIPFFALTIVSCLVTMRVQHNAFWSASSLTFSYRLENVAMSYARYLSKIFWPTDLALIYPYPHSWPIAGVAAVAIVLALLSAIFMLQAKLFPYLAVGWFWFLGTLVPVIGLVQVGVQSMADRYSYLPSIGIFILAAWGANDLLNRWPERKKFLPVAAGISLAGCLAVTSLQLRYWQDSLTLFLHTVETTADNYAAEDCLGKTLDNLGKTNEAAQLFADAVRLQPDYPMAQFDLGMCEIENGNSGDASNHLAAAVKLAPWNPVMQFDFGVFLAQNGNPAGAMNHFQAALAAKPDFPEARQQLNLLKTNSLSLDIKK